MAGERTAGAAPAAPAGRARSRPAELALGARLLGPYLLYALLESRIHDDLVALAVASALPLAIGIVTSARTRRLDWASALSFASLAAGIGIARLLGLGETAIKLRGAVDPAVLGIILLAIAVLPRRRLVWVARAAAGYARRRRTSSGQIIHNASARSEPQDPEAARGSSPSPGPHRLRHLRLLAVLWGGGLLVDAAAHVVIVYSVPTSAYLLAAKVTRWAILLILIAASRLLRRRWADPATAEPALLSH